jgi:hypothetical protein
LEGGGWQNDLLTDRRAVRTIGETDPGGKYRARRWGVTAGRTEMIGTRSPFVDGLSAADACDALQVHGRI